MDRLKAWIRHPAYHAVMAVAYLLTAAPVFLLVKGQALVLVVAIVSWETALATHLAGWAAEDAAE